MALQHLIMKPRMKWVDKVKSLIKETSYGIPDVVIDRAHRTGKDYKDKRSNVRSLMTGRLFLSDMC